MSGTWASGWATSDTVSATEFAKGVGSAYDTTLGIAAASITTPTLPTGFAHLRIELVGRGTAAATLVAVSLRFNGDSGSNYHAQILDAGSATVTASDSGASAISSGLCFAMAGASSPAGAPGGGVIEIENYNGTTFQKIYQAHGYSKESATGAGSGRIRIAGGVWLSTAAITTVTLLPAAGNFDAGTRLTCYVLGA